ncbi:MAG: ABC transporter ATP-binding protein [Candidatus Aenigmatarchaeota archaeon]
MVEVILENVTKKFGELVAVDNLSLKIKDKEFFILLGPSGCGKTTVLNLIAGLETLTSGNIYFDGEKVNELPPEKRDVAMVFQSYALYPTMNAYENIAFPLKIKKVPAYEIKKKVEEVAYMLNISQILNKKPYEMSGGERQRVALARAIIREPKLFLLDEPLSNIDAKLRTIARAELIKLQRKLQITTIYVTHDQIEAMTMGDRIAIMNQGKVLQVGDPIEIFENPLNTFVAGFVGSPSMNFFDGEIIYEGKDMFFKSSDLKIPIEKNFAAEVERKNIKLILGIRPQNLLISNISEKESGIASFQANVYVIERLGTEILINIEKDNNIYKIIVPAEAKVNIGDKILVKIKDLSKIYFFDKNTGERLR